VSPLGQRTSTHWSSEPLVTGGRVAQAWPPARGCYFAPNLSFDAVAHSAITVK
jgi:hypothetical protein